MATKKFTKPFLDNLSDDDYIAAFKTEYVYQYNIERYGITAKLASEWLKGLPSCLAIPFTYNDIGVLLENMGHKNKQAYDGDYQERHYWLALGNIIIKEFKKTLAL